jgi:hypothetical protein
MKLFNAHGKPLHWAFALSLNLPLLIQRTPKDPETHCETYVFVVVGSSGLYFRVDIPRSQSMIG